MKKLVMLALLGLATPAFAASQVGNDVNKTANDTGKAVKKGWNNGRHKTKKHARNAKARAHRTVNAATH